MKPLLLFCLLLAAGFTAQAQAQANLVHLITAGARLGVRAARGSAAGAGTNGHGQKADEYVTTATFRGQAYPLKRTPANKLKGEGGGQIAYQEKLLDACRHTMTIDSVAVIAKPAQPEPTRLAPAAKTTHKKALDVVQGFVL